jgi:hypothetical protein
VSTLGRRLLEAVVAEPGEWPVEDHASSLRVEVRSAATEVSLLRKHGLVRRTAYRLHAHITQQFVGQPATVIVGSGGLTGREQYLAVDLVQALRHLGEADGGELAAHLGQSKLSGTSIRALRALHAHGSVSLPSCLWPTEAGVAMVADWRREEVAEAARIDEAAESAPGEGAEPAVEVATSCP